MSSAGERWARNNLGRANWARRTRSLRTLRTWPTHSVRRGFQERRRLCPAYAEIPEALVKRLPAETKYGCAALGIVTTDRQQRIRNGIPRDFNPRPLTNPS